MTSTITNYSNSIVAEFPIAGADNDSQGFRTNFTQIKSALRVASTEISDLQLIVSNPANLVLNSYSKSELYNLGSLEDGTVVFLTASGYNKPVYSYDGVWYTMTGTSVSLP